MTTPNLAGIGAEAALRAVTASLAQAAIEQPEAEARLLLLAAAEVDRAALIRDPGRPLCDEAARKLASFVARRLAGEPATRIVGRRGFWTLELLIAPGVLDPRADTETLVEAAIDALSPENTQPIRILDLGTGSGALLLALLSALPQATGVGVDLSAAACALARENAERNGLADRVQILEGCWDDQVDGLFDLIVSNPPYIPTSDIPTLSREVRSHDPALALDGGADGLAAYRDLAGILPRRLAPGGLAVLELGAGQLADVTGLCLAEGLAVRAVRRDLGGVERALVLSRRE